MFLAWRAHHTSFPDNKERKVIVCAFVSTVAGMARTFYASSFHLFGVTFRFKTDRWTLQWWIMCIMGGIGRLSTEYRSIVGRRVARQSVDSQSTVGPLSFRVDRESVDSRSSLYRLFTDSRSTVYWRVGRPSADSLPTHCQPIVDRQSTDGRPIVGMISVFFSFLQNGSITFLSLFVFDPNYS